MPTAQPIQSLSELASHSLNANHDEGVILILGGLEGRRSLALTLVSLIFVRTDVSINRA